MHRGLVTFALPQHSKIDVYTTRYVSHTTTSGVPKRKDAWLIGGMKDFYKNDVRGTRGVGLHLLNTISFAKFIRVCLGILLLDFWAAAHHVRWSGLDMRGEG